MLNIRIVLKILNRMQFKQFEKDLKMEQNKIDVKKLAIFDAYTRGKLPVEVLNVWESSMRCLQLYHDYDESFWDYYENGLLDLVNDDIYSKWSCYTD